MFLDDLLHTYFRDASVFSAFDLIDGYHQIEVAEEDKHKTAFVTEQGLYEFNVMPFGLCNAPSTFQRLMNQVFKNHIGKICLAYLDDVTTYSATEEQHKIDVRSILNCMRKAGLKLNWKKCNVSQPEIEFLGHIVSKNKIMPNQSKVETIKNFKRPVNADVLHSFICSVGFYRRFIKDFATISAPLFDVIYKSKQIEWTDQLNDAFEKLRTCLITTSDENPNGILALPDFSKPFYLHCDASNVGVGSTLAQGDSHPRKPCDYFSKKFTKAQLNYSTGEKEFMSIVLGIQHRKHYLIGRHFVVVTDHRPLTHLMSKDKPSQRLERWLIIIREYDFKFQFINGTANVMADALSRWFLQNDDRNQPTSEPGIVINAIAALSHEQASDYEIAKLYEWMSNDSRPNNVNETENLNCELSILWRYFYVFVVVDSNIYRSASNANKDTILQYVVPKHRRKEIFSSIHESVTGGHLAFERTFTKIRARFFWPKYRDQIKRWCNECLSCALSKDPPRQMSQR